MKHLRVCSISSDDSEWVQIITKPLDELGMVTLSPFFGTVVIQVIDLPERVDSEEMDFGMKDKDDEDDL